MTNLLRIVLHALRSLPWPIALVLGCAAVAGYLILGALLLVPLAMFLIWCALGLVERLFTTVGSLAPRTRTPWNRLVIEIRLFRVSQGDYLRFRRTWLSCNWQELPGPDEPMPVPVHAFDRLLKEQGHTRPRRRTVSHR